AGVARAGPERATNASAAANPADLNVRRSLMGRSPRPGCPRSPRRLPAPNIASKCYDLVDRPRLGVPIPASFKRMAELRRTHRDAATGGLDIRYGEQVEGRPAPADNLQAANRDRCIRTPAAHL